MTLQIDNYPFDALPFSKLFREFLSDYYRLEPFYQANPFEIDALREHAELVSGTGTGDQTADLLLDFNRRFDPEQPALDNIDRFRDERAVALVTGQQLGMLGGPLYTVLKTLTVIHQAERLEQELERPVIPVFWLADEDHDYEEVKSVYLLDRDEQQGHALEYERDSYPPVADLELNERFRDFLDTLQEEMYVTDFTDRLWELIESCYAVGNRMDLAFGKLITALFSKHGLVLAGSNCKAIKEHSRGCLKLAVREADRIRESLDRQSEQLEDEFHRQAAIYDSNLFYIDPERGRTKISHNEGRWQTDTGKAWNTEALLELIDEKPHLFSPNVFLRPILQDRLLPTLGYVAGPGELAYYAQMKEMYALFDRPMPAILPRMSATMIEPAISRIMEELPFGVADYDRRIEDLESEYVDQAEQLDIEGLFREWKEQVEQVAEEKVSKVKEVDTTLEGAAGKTTAVYFGELDKLKGKVYRSVKQQEETQLKRIRKIKVNLFPDGVPQERSISFIYFMNKYGLDIWDRILESLDDGEQFVHHKLISL